MRSVQYVIAVASPFHSLETVAQQLPFHLNETDKVNSAFRRSRQDDDEAKYHIDLWTYCFIRRYYLIKFSRDALFSNPADMDDLISRAYLKVQDRRNTVSDSSYYASWVSVVCKNVYLNFLRSVHQVVSINQEEVSLTAHDSIETFHDVGLLYVGLRKAIERLPNFLREIALYRFIEGYTYQEIGRLIDKPMPIVRSYVNKAIQKLRKDPIFLAYLE